MDLPDSYFDMVVIHFVLHDIPENERLCVLHSLARRLKPEGHLIVREPQGEGLDLIELQKLADAVGLHKVALDSHTIVIGSVYAAHFTK